MARNFGARGFSSTVKNEMPPPPPPSSRTSISIYSRQRHLHWVSVLGMRLASIQFKACVDFILSLGFEEELSGRLGTFLPLACPQGSHDIINVLKAGTTCALISVTRLLVGRRPILAADWHLPARHRPDSILVEVPNLFIVWRSLK